VSKPTATADVGTSANVSLDKARDQSVETVGRVAEFWGFTRTQGRVFGLLFLAQKPMTQADLVDKLDVSAANISMSLNGLLRWGAVHKVYEKGARKVLYEAEPELRKIIRSVLGGREQQELQEAVDSFSESMALIDASVDKQRASPEELFLRERLEHLENVARVSHRILGLLLGDGRVDVKRELGER
jgi:HTH-type transcriptional regulator, glycine betaine synthesis regulator